MHAIAVCVALLCSCTALSAQQSAADAPADVPERTRYDNYPLYELRPTTDDQLRQLNDLQRTSDSHIFLHTGRSLASAADGDASATAPPHWLVTVAPHKRPEFEAMLRAMRIEHTAVLADLQSAIDAEAVQTARTTEFGWTAYHTLDRIYEWLDQLQLDHAAHVQPIRVGTSYEGRPLRGVKIAFGGDGADERPGVFVEGGIHAREWIAPAFVTYLINELLTSTNASVRRMAESHDWYVVPSANPDGYAYTHTANRLWRKTRTPHGLWCHGADPNRNWDFHWNEQSTSPYPCAETYAGPRPFSEPEMRDYAAFVRGLAGRIGTFVSFHAYSQLLLYPYGHTGQPARNSADLLAIGRAAAAALAARHGTRYEVGSIHDTIYPASGASTDYVYEVLGVPLAYTFELRPGSDGGRRGFELPADQIVPVGEETVDALVALLERARELGYNRPGGAATVA